MNAVVEMKTEHVAQPVMNPMQMVAHAVQQGMPIETLREIRLIQKEWEADEARKDYMAALARMKAELPIEIFKRKKVDVPGGAKFKHAELADVVDACCAAMGKFGFVHRWIPRQEDGAIVVKCIVTHERGHSEECELRGAPDDSGKKNAIQQVGSTVTYLERYTLQAILGVAAKNQDDDGKAASAQKESEIPAAPANYKNWKADMQAVADEGMKRLSEVWDSSALELRQYTNRHDKAWWQDAKALAARVDKKVAS